MAIPTPCLHKPYTLRFQDIPGQSALSERLVQLHHTDRLPHTMLLAGKNGYGALGIALALAQFVHCEHQGEHDSCGECKSCRLNQKFTHPDLHFSFPFFSNKKEHKETCNDFLKEWRAMLSEHPYFAVSEWLISVGGDNKLGNINAKEISSINSRMALKSFGSGKKILIIWMAEYLGTEGNKLLKLIEEPPEDTLIILVAENTERVLSTIISRCQLFPVSRVSDDALRGYLAERGTEAGQDIDTVVRLADGHLNAAVRLSEDVNDQLSVIFKGWMQCCFMKDGVKTMKFVTDNGSIGRESQKAFVAYGLHFFGEFMKYFAIGDAEILRLTNAERVSVQKLRNRLDFENLENIIATLEHMSIAIERNASYKMLLLSATNKIHRYFSSSYTTSAVAD